jgi:hypothetical protein
MSVLVYHSDPVFDKPSDCLAYAVVSKTEAKAYRLFDNASYLYDLLYSIFETSDTEFEPMIYSAKLPVVDSMTFDGITIHKIVVGTEEFWTHRSIEE